MGTGQSSLGATVSPTTAGRGPGAPWGSPLALELKQSRAGNGGSQKDTPVPGRGAGSQRHRQGTR